MSKEKLCKNCGKSIDKKAVVCTSCGVKIKKPFFKKWWFWVIVVVIVIAISSGTGSESETSTQESQETKQSETQPKEEVIDYEACTVTQLLDELEENALKAEKKYQNKYVEITGTLSNIDSDGRYISLADSYNEFRFIWVNCYIKNEEQEAKIMELTKGDILTIKGKIKSVGEIMGYSLDIDSIN